MEWLWQLLCNLSPPFSRNAHTQDSKFGVMAAPKSWDQLVRDHFWLWDKGTQASAKLLNIALPESGVVTNCLPKAVYSLLRSQSSCDVGLTFGSLAACAASTLVVPKTETATQMEKFAAGSFLCSPQAIQTLKYAHQCHPNDAQANVKEFMTDLSLCVFSNATYFMADPAKPGSISIAGKPLQEPKPKKNQEVWEAALGVALGGIAAGTVLARFYLAVKQAEMDQASCKR